MQPLEIWPVAGLRITTPRLTLRPVFGDLMFDVANLAAQGIHDPAFMPFFVPWTDAPSPELERETVRHFCTTWSTFRPDAWKLPFAVFEGDALVGVQAVDEAKHYAVTKSFGTGSWLGRAHQGKGIGKEMRAAVLHLMFDALGAERAHSGAFVDNAASLSVTRSLGYVENGRVLHARRDEPAELVEFRLDRVDWLERRRDDIDVAGVTDELLAFLGMAPDLSPLPPVP